jgi:hypothetical protein
MSIVGLKANTYNTPNIESAEDVYCQVGTLNTASQYAEDGVLSGGKQTCTTQPR